MVGVPGYSELVIIFLIILLLFGGKKLPELARSLGSAIDEFSKASRGLKEGITGEEETKKEEKPIKVNKKEEEKSEENTEKEEKKE